MLLSTVVILIPIVIYRLQFIQGPPGRALWSNYFVNYEILSYTIRCLATMYIARDGYSKKSDIYISFPLNGWTVDLCTYIFTCTAHSQKIKVTHVSSINSNHTRYLYASEKNYSRLQFLWVSTYGFAQYNVSRWPEIWDLQGIHIIAFSAIGSIVLSIPVYLRAPLFWGPQVQNSAGGFTHFSRRSRRCKQSRKLKSRYMRQGIDSRNRAWNWVAKLRRLVSRYDNPMPTWFLAPKAGLELPVQNLLAVRCNAKTVKRSRK